MWIYYRNFVYLWNNEFACDHEILRKHKTLHILDVSWILDHLEYIHILHSAGLAAGGLYIYIYI